MHRLLTEALVAHGGLERWRSYQTLSATIVTSGAFWGMKGLVQDSDPRRITVTLDHEWATLAPFGAPDWRSVFRPERIAICDSSDRVVAERMDPRSAFAGHEIDTPWDPLHRAYFNGYALWTYLTTPFLLAEPDVGIEDIPPIEAGGETWRGLRATFPARIATHSTLQDFYFGPDGLLARHDYHVDVAGGFAGAHLVSDFVEVAGFRFPTRRRAYRQGEDGMPILDPVMVSIDVSDFALA